MRAFVAKHVVPFHAQWEKDGMVDRAVWLEAGKQGLLGIGRAGAVRRRRGRPTSATTASSARSSSASAASGVGFTLHNDVVAPYLLELTTDEQKAALAAAASSAAR